MKKLLFGCCLVLTVLLLSQAGQAEVVNVTKVVIEQVTGADADFVEEDGTLYFSGGVAGFFVTESGTRVTFGTGTIIGEFYGCVDTSSGGVASAYFDDGFLSMNLDGPGEAGQYVKMLVLLQNYYNEDETTADTDETTHLNGMALVTVDQAEFSNGWLTGGLTYEWADAIGETSGLITETTLPYGINITDFLLDYSATNAIITLYADESSVPEPVTIALLGFGALLIRKRRS